MTEPLDTDVAIEAPEHIVFRHRVAGPARRALAQLVDLVICYTALFVVGAIVVLSAGGSTVVGDAVSGTLGAGIGLLLLLLFLVQWVYFVAWEATTGRTPGKMALDLRVLTTTGKPVGLREAALRNVLRAADILPTAYLVGLCAMTLSRRFQRLGDLVAGTMVIAGGRVDKAAPLRLWPPIQPNEMLVLPTQVTLDPEERAALELFLRRRGTLGGPREWELASMIAAPLGRLHGFQTPDPARTLAVLYDRAMNAGRSEAPASSRAPSLFAQDVDQGIRRP
jgi:uncharacterized RDD family membrane protein YckC